MILEAEYARAVLRGDKTMIRRPVTKADEIQTTSMRTGEVTSRAHCRYKPGKRYAIQPGTGKKAIGHIVVVKTRQEVLGLVDDADAQAEGYANREEFLDAWREAYGRVDPFTKVWVVEFVVDYTERPRLLADRRRPYHDSLGPDEDPIGHQNEQDYVSTLEMAIDDVNTVSPDVQDAITYEAKQKARHHREKLRSNQSLLDSEARIRELQEEAKRRRIPIRDEMRLLRKLKAEGRPTTTPMHNIIKKLDADLNRAA